MIVARDRMSSESLTGCVGLRTLERAIGRLYRLSGFRFEPKRVAHLFQPFEKETAPLNATSTARLRRRRQAAAESSAAGILSHA
jgi:hypothetical protein